MTLLVFDDRPSPAARRDGDARGSVLSARERPDAAASDEALAARARAGSAECFGQLVDRYEGRLTGFLQRRGASRHDAEDLAQEACLRAWQRIQSYDPSRRFSVWLFTIAARVSISAWRASRNGRADQSPALERQTAVRDGGDAVERTEIWLIAERVLDPDTVAALWLRYAAGLEATEVARVLGRTAVGVRVLLHRARKRLAAELARGNHVLENARTSPGARGSDQP